MQILFLEGIESVATCSGQGAVVEVEEGTAEDLEGGVLDVTERRAVSDGSQERADYYSDGTVL